MRLDKIWTAVKAAGTVLLLAMGFIAVAFVCTLFLQCVSEWR